MSVVEEEKVEEENGEEEKNKDYKNASKFSRVCGLIANYIVGRLGELSSYVSEAMEEEYSLEDTLALLNKNPQLLSFDLLEERIMSDRKLAIMVNTASSFCGALIRRQNSWKKEWLSNKNTLFREVLENNRRDLYPLLNDKDNLISFITDYITFKLQLDR